MAVIVDTKIAIHLRDRDQAMRDKMDSVDDDVFMSVVTQVELEGGVSRDPSQAAVRRARLDLMLAAIPVLPFDRDDAGAYRTIIQAVGYSRRKVLDRMIAAQALVRGATLITLNVEDFRDVPGLELVAW